MEETHGPEATTALAQLPRTGQLTETQAKRILSLVYPGVPEEEVVRCAILCRDYGLHPLMKEVYIIPFGQGDKRTWATVLGINATRKMMSQRGTFSYLDMTPRVMTEDEQKTIFGEVDDKNIVAITKLQTREGEKAQGYGRWPKNDEPYGTNKGNTKANMAFIRSERNAFGRLFTDALPLNVEVIDEAYADVPDIGKVARETGEIIEGEAVEIPEKPAEKPEPAKPKPKVVTKPSPATSFNFATKDEIAELKKQMEIYGWTRENVGKYVAEKKWGAKRLTDLSTAMVAELIEQMKPKQPEPEKEPQPEQEPEQDKLFTE